MRRTLTISLSFFSAVFLAELSGLTVGFGQQQQPPIDTSRGLPRLEIPEITIIGKKAITLPFARKGEIYDVNIYEALPPDTSLLEQRPAISLPIGSLPRYDEPLVPWHASAEGSFGSFTTLNGRAFVDYVGRQWGIFGNTGFSTTQGYVDNSQGNAFHLEGNAHSIVSTDNDILKSFRVAGGMRVLRESYGMLGIQDTLVDRSRTNVVLDARLNSLEHETNDIALNLSANIWSIGDERLGTDSSASVVSPELAAAYATNVGSLRLLTGLSYTSSSLNYQRPVQSPSLMDFHAGAQWEVVTNWFLSVGGRINSGSASDGGSRSLVAPFASARWQLDADRQVTFWLKPEMRLPTYNDYIGQNPYLVREIVLRPERTPFNLGGSFWFNSDRFSIEVLGSFAKTSDRSVTLADDSGRIRLHYVEASIFSVQANGMVQPLRTARIKFTGSIQPAYEDGQSTQLPMTPLVRVGGRGEIDLKLPLTLWSAVEYTSKQNVDLAGTSRPIGDRVLVDIGASTNFVPKTVLSLEVANVFNTAYEWWRSYIAPGRRVTLEAKVNMR